MPIRQSQAYKISIPSVSVWPFRRWEQTPIPTGAPKTGYMIESMVSAAVQHQGRHRQRHTKRETATWNAICLADMGDTGVSVVALPQMAPRNVTWAKKGKWVHFGENRPGKILLRKMKKG